MGGRVVSTDRRVGVATQALGPLLLLVSQVWPHGDRSPQGTPASSVTRMSLTYLRQTEEHAFGPRGVHQHSGKLT